MTYQCRHVLSRIKRLAKNSDCQLRYDYGGILQPFSSDDPFEDCSVYKKEILSIMQSLEKEQYITMSGTTFRLTQKGIHIYQYAFQHILKIIYDKWIPFIALIISVLSFMKSYGISLDDAVTWCMRLLKTQ